MGKRGKSPVNSAQQHCSVQQSANSSPRFVLLVLSLHAHISKYLFDTVRPGLSSFALRYSLACIEMVSGLCPNPSE